MNMLEQKVQAYIKAENLFDTSGKILVALSGGADSVALLRVLLNLGYDCIAAHCNFHLRGEESDRDEFFVRTLCEQLGVPLFVTHFQTKEYARTHTVSIEMAARDLRYGWFQKLAKEEMCAFIAVGHHRNDSVETLLLNLIRGTGLYGLKGIVPRRGNICRPLLNVNREEILAYLASLKQGYVNDSTNEEQVFLRNKIRHTILPLLETCNPNIEQTLFQTMAHLSEVEKVYESKIQHLLQEITIASGTYSIKRILASPSPKALLFELLQPAGFNSSQQEDVYDSLLNAQSGKVFYSPAYVLLRDREYLILKSVEGEKKDYKLCSEIVNISPDTFSPPQDKLIACLDMEKLKQPLSLRIWKSGDKFVPLGMNGYKKVRDFLRDNKLSLFDKAEQYVVLSGEDIVWLVNQRIDDRFKVTKDTRTMLKVWVEEKHII